MTADQDILDINAEIRRIISDAQADWTLADQQRRIPALITRSRIGSIADYTTQVDALVGMLVQPPTPTPIPPPGPTTPFTPPVPNGGILGMTKWLPGSLGVDVFVPRGTPVVAPAECVVEEVIGGTGLSGGAELILALPDKSWAWRWRHCQALSGIKVGTRLTRGQPAAQVLDTSLDSLGAIPHWAGQMPDGWQHCDLSVNKGSDRFAPTGGGGGNVSAYQWLVDNGYQGRVLQRTPGPPDAGVGLAEAIAMMMPSVYREENRP